MLRVPSIADRPANSRWRPTLPPRRQPSAAARGLLRAMRGMQLFGVVLLVGDGIAMACLRHGPHGERLAVVETGCLILLLLTAVATAATWWLSWRQAASDARGERG